MMVDDLPISLQSCERELIQEKLFCSTTWMHSGVTMRTIENNSKNQKSEN